MKPSVKEPPVSMSMVKSIKERPLGVIVQRGFAESILAPPRIACQQDTGGAMEGILHPPERTGSNLSCQGRGKIGILPPSPGGRELEGGRKCRGDPVWSPLGRGKIVGARHAVPLPSRLYQDLAALASFGHFECFVYIVEGHFMCRQGLDIDFLVPDELV